jgi:site-specific recombinase XerD
MTPAPLSHWLHAFFHEWLGEQRNCSHHTILSYRDTWRLYLRDVAARRGRSVSALSLADLTAEQTVAFLGHVESERCDTIGTRNCRLAAIRSFFRFVADHEPLAAAQCAAVLRIPTKKAPRPAIDYLETEEATAILKQPDRSTPEGQRDHALLALLYNTGGTARAAAPTTCWRAKCAVPWASSRPTSAGRRSSWLTNRSGRSARKASRRHSAHRRGRCLAGGATLLRLA